MSGSAEVFLGEDCFLSANNQLRPAHAVAALLVLENGHYIMQLRDNSPNIFYPSHWGCFGGAIDPGETEDEALVRELQEELCFAPHEYKKFIKIDFDYRDIGLSVITRQYYEIKVSNNILETFQLGEGSAFKVVGGSDLLTNYRITPYDGFVIWVHQNQNRLI
jgi:ADP-ribose pyrophosphatase YjhB (NUDIX family)